MRKYVKSVTALMLIAVIVSSTVSILFMSGMIMSEHEMTTNCLFMMEETSLCSMTAVDYIKAWKNMFVGAHIAFALMSAVLLVVVRTIYLLRKTIFQFCIKHREQITAIHFLFLLLIKGRLRPKIY